MNKLIVRDLGKTYSVGRKGSIVALEGVDLDVPGGSITTIVGASGCGKSTLLSVAGGLDTPTTGSVEVDGELVVGPGPDRGMVFQAYSLYPWKTVRENIAFGLEVARRPRAERAARVTELLGVVGLTEFADALPREMSGGMRQRVA